MAWHGMGQFFALLTHHLYYHQLGKLLLFCTLCFSVTGGSISEVEVNRHTSDMASSSANSDALLQLESTFHRLSLIHVWKTMAPKAIISCVIAEARKWHKHKNNSLRVVGQHFGALRLTQSWRLLYNQRGSLDNHCCPF